MFEAVDRFHSESTLGSMRPSDRGVKSLKSEVGMEICFCQEVDRGF